MEDLSPKPGDLEPIETACRDEIAALQLERMKWSLRHAYDNVPHYKAQLSTRPACIRTICKSLSDLARVSLHRPSSDLRDNYPFGMFAVPREQIARIHASSGTTGQPTVVGYTAQRSGYLGHGRGAVACAPRGCDPGDILHNAYGYGLFTGGLGIHLGPEKLGLTTVPVSGGMTQRQVRLIEDFGADGITVTPSYALSILDEYAAQGLDPRKSPLKVGIFGAEPWTNAMRREIEDAFDMHAVDIYGLSEVIGPGVANECVETKDGLHIWEDHFYPEVINPETGEVLPDGELGELVFTSLTKEAFPIMRYRTRDLTRLLPGTARTHAADGKDHRAQRRHDHPARRQRLPDPDRGTADGGAATLPRISRSSCTARTGWTRCACSCRGLRRRSAATGREAAATGSWRTGSSRRSASR